MDLSRSLLSDIIIYSKYARYLEDKSRRETWKEIVDRNKNMHIKKFPFLKEEIENAYKFVYDKKVLPSMRAMQFSGKPIELMPNRGYNCCALPINHPAAFHEIMFLLLGGSGVGYSVQKKDVSKLPPIRGVYKKKTQRFLVPDTIEGWAESIRVLMDSYFNHKSQINFDFRDIRPKGTLLKTSGGLAPGPQPLKDCIHNIRKVLDAKEPNTKLTTLETHDIICFIADCVLAGGIRRAALIAIFNLTDEDMITSKYSNWWELNPQRARSNNSATVLRHKIDKKTFQNFLNRIKMSGSGEPGLSFSNDSEYLWNPCHEASLRPHQFCNLTNINMGDVESQKDFEQRVTAAAFIGTLQASYTDFAYLREEWKEVTEKEALLGVCLTGIASGNLDIINLRKGAKLVKKENARVAKLININPGARLTMVKPDGSGSLVLGTSSGIHAWHSPFYIRRIRLNKSEPLYKYLLKKVPKLIEDDFLRPQTDAVLSIPIKAPDNAKFRSEPAIDLLERVKKVYSEWIKPGHISGNNTHNVSATISIRENEWDIVGQWMWKNKNYYSGLSILPYDGGNYIQAPFQETTETKYNELLEYLQNIDLTEIKETEDKTTRQSENACGGSGSCEII